MKNLYWMIVRYINMKLFEIIPADFFSVLVSPNREIYADALMKLYEMFRTEINIRLKSFLAEVEILLEDREYILEEGDEAEDMEPSSLRGKARLIVRRFVKTGWIDREFLDGSFTEIIIPNSYAITMMRMLKELTDEGGAEYDSLVFSTYSALNQAYMLLRLRTEILPTVQPYRMNIPELKAYCDFTRTFSNDYAEKLQKLCEEERLSDCRACINYMLTHKIRLEQEAMLT